MPVLDASVVVSYLGRGEGLESATEAIRDNLTFSDAMYVALAELLDIPLTTFDARLAAAPGHRAEVVLLSA